MAEDDRKGRGKGRGGDGGGGGGGNQKREDSPFEVGLGLAIEKIASVIGRPVGALLTSDEMGRLKGLARNKQLGVALRTLGPMLEILYGDDEEIRGAIRGGFEGLATGVNAAPADNPDAQLDFLKNQLVNDVHFRKLDELAKTGRFELARMVSFEEAYAKMNFDHKRVVTKFTGLLNDKGEHLKARFTPTGLQGIAEMLIKSDLLLMSLTNPIDPDDQAKTDKLVEQFKVRFTAPKSAPEKTVSDLAHAIELGKKELEKLNKDASGNPHPVTFAQRVSDKTNARAAGHEDYRQVMEELTNPSSSPPKGPGVFARIKNAWSALMGTPSPTPPTPGPRRFRRLPRRPP